MTVLSRFENVAVKDSLGRIAMDGGEKFRVQSRPVWPHATILSAVNHSTEH